MYGLHGKQTDAQIHGWVIQLVMPMDGPEMSGPRSSPPFFKRSPGNEEPVIYGSRPSPARSTPERPLTMLLMSASALHPLSPSMAPSVTGRDADGRSACRTANLKFIRFRRSNPIRIMNCPPRPRARRCGHVIHKMLAVVRGRQRTSACV
jgi:hypothetical protein